MKNDPTASNRLRWFSRAFSFVLVFNALLLACQTVAAQSKPTDGGTPLGLQAGAPAGSYSLGGGDNVNLYNGALNYTLPLLSIGGRGGAGHSIVLPFERHFMVEKYVDPWGSTWQYPIDGREEEIKPGYGPGVMAIRYSGGYPTACPTPTPEPGIEYEGDPTYYYGSTLTRLSFTRGDGTETEFRDVQTGGQAHTTAWHFNCDTGSPYDRGHVFVSVDGSAATFISDGDLYDQVLISTAVPEEYSIDGYLLLRDGTRYRIDHGLVTWIRDRNGNKISFEYDSSSRVTTITDSLNRQVTIVYDYNEGGSYGVCDKITYKGFNGTYGTTRTIRVSKTTLSNVLRSGYSLTYVGYLFPGLGGSTSTYYNPTVVSSVWLPDADGVTRRYQFQYNNYGELARTILPTGGAFEYDYGRGTTNGTTEGLLFLYSYYQQQIYRRVIERREYPDGSSGSSYANKMTYSVPETEYSDCCISTAGYVTVEQRDASNNLLAKSKHYFTGPGGAPTLSHAHNALTDWDAGKEYQTDVFDTNGSTVLRRTVNTWEYGTPIASNSSQHINGRINETDTTLEPSGANLVSKQTFSYDQYNNQTAVYEYDYGSGSAGSLVRHTSTSYLTTQSSSDYACDPSSSCSTSASASSAIHIRSLPTQVSVYDSGGTERARTAFEYDNYGSDSTHAGLISRSSISGLDSAFSTSLVTRGNATGTTHYLLNSSGSVTGSVSTYAQYDVAGNVVKAIDARGYATTFDFTDRFGAPNGDAEANTSPTELSTPGKASYAFATKVTNALNQSAYVQFDYYLGKPVDAEDANGIVASGYYNDVLDRPTQVKRAVGVSGVENQTTIAYDDAGHTVTTTSDLSSNGDNTLKSVGIYDDMGRTTESRQYETSSNYIVTKRDYDVLGRAYRVSNPYRPWNSESAVWNTVAYDALGRTVSATTPDSAVVTTSYYGNTVTATDQASKSRKSVTDALGRLTTVYEDPSSLNYSTSYTYDVLNNLTQVSQGSQTRTFAYDSLKRLTSASNPESGTATVDAYDNNGNILVSTDARSVSTHVSYDELNRPTRRWYNGSTSTSYTTNNSPSTGVASTDEVAFYYDSQSLPSGAPSFTRGSSTGALVAITYGGGSEGTYRGYDAMGRVVRQYQRTDSVNYLVEATYNVGSAVATETYPSVPGASDRRSVSFSYDNAGRLSSLSSSATSYAPAASVSSIGYSSQNALSTETYGNSLIHAVSYNNRLQPTEIKLGTSSNSTSVLDLNYSYGTTTNNGNIQSYTYSGGGLSYTQSFTYDSLNRLSTATETNGGSTNWSQTNAYDRYGNRQIDYGGGSYNLAFSSSTNRITTSGYSYDSSGNLTNDGSHSYGFDAESKVKSVDSTTAYTYDGEAKRVRKLVGENTRFIYGIGGQLVAEYDGSSGNLKKEYISGGITIEPTAVNSNGTQYPTGDHLGSPRVITNSSGSVVSRHDYMPFGEELGASVGGRTTGIGFSSSGDNNRKKFTGYERDTETGLDFAQARFYGSTQGRFTSSDPFSASAIIADPQTFNRYAYCRNNPVNSTDPTGMAAGVMAMPTGERANVVNALIDTVHEDIGQMERAWEQQVHEAFLGVHQNESVTVFIGDSAEASDVSQSTQQTSIAAPLSATKSGITVTVTADPVIWRRNDELVKDELYFTGFGSLVTVTISKGGKGVSGVTGIEFVTGTGCGPDKTIKQNPRRFKTKEDGNVFDLVGVGLQTTSKETNVKKIQDAFIQNTGTACTQETKQTMNVQVPGVGAFRISFNRTLTNIDSNKDLRLNSITPGGRNNGNYVIDVRDLRITPIR